MLCLCLSRIMNWNVNQLFDWQKLLLIYCQALCQYWSLIFDLWKWTKTDTGVNFSNHTYHQQTFFGLKWRVWPKEDFFTSLRCYLWHWFCLDKTLLTLKDIINLVSWMYIYIRRHRFNLYDLSVCQIVKTCEIMFSFRW